MKIHSDSAKFERSLGGAGVWGVAPETVVRGAILRPLEDPWRSATSDEIRRDAKFDP